MNTQPHVVTQTVRRVNPHTGEPVFDRDETEIVNEYQVTPELTIAVKGAPKDTLGNVTGREQTFASMSVQMPAPAPLINFDRILRGQSGDGLCPTGSQVEEFLEGIGLRLPGRTIAKKLMQEVRTLTERIAGIERNATDNIQRARAERDTIVQRTSHEIGQLGYSRDSWRKYAEALEARIERGGGRLSKQLRELRPLNESV